MSERDVVTLTEFGLTVLQAKAYVAMLAIGDTAPSQLSRAIGVVRPEAYRVLHELSAKGLVYKTLRLPSVYTAVRPKEAISKLIQNSENALLSLKRKQNPLVSSLSSTNVGTQSIIERFTLIAGGENVQLRVNQMIDNARNEYVSINSKNALRRMDRGWVKAITRAKRRKLQMRVIAEVDRSNLKSADYLSQRVDLRVSRDILFYLDVADRKEAVFGPAFPTSEEELTKREQDIWTNNPTFAHGMHAMFERLWRASRPYVTSERAH